VKSVLCAVVLGAVVVALVKQFHQVTWSAVRFEPWLFVAAVVCLLGVSAMQLAARWTLLMAYGYRLGWRVQLPAAWVPQLGKYLPGGIASVAGTVYLLRKHGVPGAVGLSVAVLLDALAVIAGLIVSTPLLVWGPVREQAPWAWVGCVFFILIGLLMLHPRIFVGMLNIALRRVGRQPIENVPTIGRYLWPVIASFGQWVFAGLALWLMTLAVTRVSVNLLPLFIASAALAMTVSYLTPFAPGGIGIREGLYLITLGPMAGPEVAIVIVAMRVVQTMIEVGLAVVGLAVMREKGNTSVAPTSVP